MIAMIALLICSTAAFSQEPSDVGVSAAVQVPPGIEDFMGSLISEVRFQEVSGRRKIPVGDWKNLNETLSRISKGELNRTLESDRLSLLKRALDQAIATNGYFGGRVVATRAIWGSEGAILIFEIDPGDRVIFGFRGNERFTRADLMEWVRENFQAGTARDYVELIRQRILDEYLKIGFSNTKVEMFSYENLYERERRISFHITEGRRYRINRVEFDGNEHFLGEDLKNRFFEYSSYLISQGIYIEGDIEPTAFQVVEYMRSKGFLSAKLITVRQDLNEEKGTVDLVVYIFEGEQTIIRSIKIDGLKFIQEDLVREYLGIQEDMPLNLFKFSEGLEKLKSLYLGSGHLDFSISNEEMANVIRYFSKNRWADIWISGNEGPRYRVGKIEIEGLEQTRRWVVEREIIMPVGDLIDAEFVNGTEARLRKLGIFASVKSEFRPFDEAPESKILVIIVEEANPGTLGGGLGIRNDLGPRVFGEVGYTNVMGRGHSWQLRGNVNRRIEDFRIVEYEVRTSYVWPWFLGVDISMSPELAQQRKTYPKVLDTDSLIFTNSIQKVLWQKWNLVAALGYSLERTRQFNAEELELNETIRIGSLVPSLRMDMRDSPLSPTRGFYSTVSYEVASSWFGAQSQPYPIGFTRFSFRTDYHFSAPKLVRWYLSMRTGFARNSVDPEQDGKFDPRVGVPYIRQFALGGVNSLRGFKPQSINHRDTQIFGTQSFVNYRTQFDIPVLGFLRAGPFLDAGSLMLDTYSLTRELRYGAGFGFHYSTPVGPVNFEWGFNLRPNDDESTNEFYFSVGVI